MKGKIEAAGGRAHLFATPPRKVVRVAPGTEVEVSEGGQSFGSGGYHATWAWDGARPTAIRLLREEDTDFVWREMYSVAMAAGSRIRCIAGDCIGEGGRIFADTEYVCE